MQTAIREFVRQRAGNRCEYCRLPQLAAPYFSFHIEHIRAQQHGGTDEPANLALACPDCNAKKGPNVATISSETGGLIELYDPRRFRWDDHFAIVGPEIVGITAIGRATVQLLDMNEPERLAVRAQLIAEGLI